MLGTLNEKGQLPDVTFLEILKLGDILPDSVNIEETAQEIKEAKRKAQEEMMEMKQMGGPQPNGQGPGRPGQIRRADAATINNN